MKVEIDSANMEMETSLNVQTKAKMKSGLKLVKELKLNCTHSNACKYHSQLYRLIAT